MDGHFALTMRARVQLRASAVFRDEIDAFSAGEEPVDLLFQVRRARLLFIGNLPQHDLLLYLQLGLGPSDIDGENPIPLRDWVVAYNRWPSLSFRFGQMKVPYSRERLMSSSALEFTDRTVVNAAMNLDRDVGAQVYSNDVLGLGGRLAYQAGVYNGEGRNEVNLGTGLLYAARASLQPFGEFPDTLSQADLVRSAEPRLSLGLAAAANRASLKENGTFGDALTVPHDTDHGAADVLFKWRGLSVHAETLARSERAVVDGEPTTPELWGWMTQVGYVTPWFSEVAVRFAEVRPLRAPDDTLYGGPTVTVGHYFREHDLKL
jgi:phosphate-selective porin OprO/OprP